MANGAIPRARPAEAASAVAALASKYWYHWITRYRTLDSSVIQKFHEIPTFAKQVVQVEIGDCNRPGRS